MTQLTTVKRADTHTRIHRCVDTGWALGLLMASARGVWEIGHPRQPTTATTTILLETFLINVYVTVNGQRMSKACLCGSVDSNGRKELSAITDNANIYFQLKSWKLLWRHCQERFCSGKCCRLTSDLRWLDMSAAWMHWKAEIWNSGIEESHTHSTASFC